MLSQSERLPHQIAADFSVLTIRTNDKIFYYQTDAACSVYDTSTKMLTAYGQEDRRRDLYAECLMIQSFLDKRCREILFGIANYLALSKPPTNSFMHKCSALLQDTIRLAGLLMSKEDVVKQKSLPLTFEEYQEYHRLFRARAHNPDPILPSTVKKLIRRLASSNDPILTQSFSSLEDAEHSSLEDAEQILYKLAHRDTQSSTYQTLLQHRAQKIEIIEPRLRNITEVFQQSQKPLSLQVSAYVSEGGGTAGLAKLIARDLGHRFPSLQVQLDIVGGNDSTQIFGMKQNPAREIKRTDCILNIAFGIMTSQRSPHIPDITFDTLPREMNGEDALLQNRLLTLDIASAFGAIPFDHSLSSRRATADTWDTVKLFAARNAWMSTALDNETQAFLHEYCHHAPSTQGWGFGYYQDAKGFLKSVEKVIAWHNKHLTPQQPLLYFVIDGKHTRFIHGEANREAIAAQGARVIDATTNTIYHPSKPSAVTICFLDSLLHDDILSLLSELHGLPMKESYQTGKGTFWSQLPALVTGNASTFEAISAGLPVLHDSYDAGLHGFDLAAKQLANMCSPNIPSIVSHECDKLPPLRALTIQGRQLSDVCSHRDLGTELILQMARRLSQTHESLLV
jgi:hypothetical protein